LFVLQQFGETDMFTLELWFPGKAWRQIPGLPVTVAAQQCLQAAVWYASGSPHNNGGFSCGFGAKVVDLVVGADTAVKRLRL
jgi:hypothetical protein